MSEDRGAILARRKRFVIVALAGVGCASHPPASPPAATTRPVPSEMPEPDAGSPEPAATRDTDQDGFQDAVDECPEVIGRVEGCPRPCLLIIPPAELEIRDNVYFKAGQSKIQPASFPILDEIATLLKQRPEYELTVGGHTHKGEPDRVAQARAEAVRDYLITKGVANEQIVVKWFGHDRPLDYKAERNRRVEFFLEEKK
jgi:outer membrane protein OmpA-like peptidoglycan-associated protein